MSIKTNFMHYMDYIMWTRIRLPVVFQKFDMVYIFISFFLFATLSIGKRSTLAKIWGVAALSQPLHFYGPEDDKTK